MATAKPASKRSPEKTSRCWPGFTPVPGKKPFAKGSCRKKKCRVEWIVQSFKSDDGGKHSEHGKFSPMDPVAKESVGEKCACGYLLRGLQTERCPECGRNVSSFGDVPLASYFERRLEMRRDFTLYAEKIMVLQKHISGTGNWVPVHLASLSPDTTTIWTRSKLPSTASLLLLAGVVMISIRYECPWLFPSSAFYFVGCTLSVIGLVLLIATIRAVEFVRFHAKDRPEVVLLDVGRAGPQAAKFNDFVAETRSAIKSQQRRTVEPRKSGRRGPLGPRPPTPPDVLIVSGGFFKRSTRGV